VDRSRQQHLWINRKHHRVDTELGCELCLPEGGLVPARIIDLSVGGLKFSCDRQALFSILPEDQRTPGQVSDVELEMRFEFQPLHQPVTSIRVRVLIIHSERLAQDKYHVGVEFIDMDSATARALVNYIEEWWERQQS